MALRLIGFRCNPNTQFTAAASLALCAHRRAVLHEPVLVSGNLAEVVFPAVLTQVQKIK